MPIGQLPLKYWLENAGYRHCCFISWPSAGGPLVRRLVDKLKRAIEEQAALLGLPPSVFSDSDIPLGTEWEARMSRALFESVAMIAICGPAYYESEWCGREWAGMRDLGLRRLGSDGIILPLVFQPARSRSTEGLIQAEVLPPPVNALNCRIDLSRLRLRSSAYERSGEFDDIVEQISERIASIAEKMAVRQSKIEIGDRFALPLESAFAGFKQEAQFFPLMLASEGLGTPQRADLTSPIVSAGIQAREDADEGNSGAHTGSTMPFDGGIVTFYSFKGGVGRSMAVANVGRVLARSADAEEKPSLIVDWDLEAPGLHRYFPEANAAKRGLIDYFYTLAEALRTSGRFCLAMRRDPGRAQILNREIPIGNYLVESGAPGLWLMTAGSTDPASIGIYQQLVGGFDWIGLFKNYPFAIAAFREMLNNEFRYCLIDSRTGLSDTAGICTSVLPDRLVAMFAPNRQNERIVELVEATLEFRRLSDDERPLVVFPVASNFDPADLAGLQISLKSYSVQFTRLLKRLYQLENCDLSRYFDEVLLLYVPHYSYGETVVVNREEPSYAGSLRRSYERLARYLVKERAPWST